MFDALGHASHFFSASIILPEKSESPRNNLLWFDNTRVLFIIAPEAITVFMLKKKNTL
jgi:hypothetical protein